MNTTLKKQLPMLMAFVLVLTLVFTMGFALVGGVASADGEITGTKLDEITIGHISDVHYFPLAYCYQDVSAEDYKDSDFYYSLTGDTKLVMESGNILYANVMRMIEDAKTGKAPLYVVASGDLTKNGERVAHIDVANALRYMQNTIRALGVRGGVDYSDFQVFATSGNHDLYNGSGALYDAATGDGWAAEGVTAAQFALIYAGLGYPDRTLSELTEIYGADYWSSAFTGGYIASTNSDSVSITYRSPEMQAIANGNYANTAELIQKYFSVGDGNNAITFAAKAVGRDYAIFVIDATDRETVTPGTPVRINAAEYASLGANAANAYTYYKLAENKRDFVKLNGNDAITAAFAAGAVFRDSTLSHLTGGRITESTFEWLSSTVNTINAMSSFGDVSYFATFHQNLIPHFDQEDDILKDFVLYNWEYTCKRFAALGIRVSLTGHQHASDIASYTDASGRTIYDMETGSSVSVDSPIRYVTMTRYNVTGGRLAEKVDSRLLPMDCIGEAPLAETPSSNVFTASAWNESAYQTAIAAYNADKTEAKWNAVIAANPDYYTYTCHHDEMKEDSFNEYIYDEIYGQLLERLLDHFLNEERLMGTLNGLIGKYLGPDSGELKISIINLTSYKPVLLKMANYIINVLWEGLYADKDNNGYGDYVFNGVTYDNVVQWVKAVAWDVLDMEYGDATLGKMKLADLAVYVLTTSAQGNEPNSEFVLSQAGITDETNLFFKSDSPTDAAYRARYAAALKDFADQCTDGKLVNDLLTKLLTPLFYNEDSVLKTLLSYKFDFTSAKCGLTEAELTKLVEYDEDGEVIGGLIDVVNTVVKMFAGEDADIEISVDNFVLQDVINGAMPIVSTLLDSLLGFSVNGTDVVEILQGFLDDYLTESFYVGLGGIARNIVVAFGTDDSKDVADVTDPTKPLTLTPANDFVTISVAGTATTVSYIAGQPLDGYGSGYNANVLATALTANFDTVNGETAFTLSYYTDEDVFATFAYRKVGDTDWIECDGAKWNVYSTADRELHYAVSGANRDNLVGSASASGIKIDTVTAPAYIPLIDLGVLCLQHAATYHEEKIDGEKVDVYYTCRDRDVAAANSVLYRNRHTVTVTGLTAGTTYEYKIGATVYTYNADGSENTVSVGNALCGNVAQPGEQQFVDFTFTTAKAASASEFEFLAIADLQGMVPGMYEESLAAFDAINGSDALSSYDFVLNAGDMTDNGKNFYQWQWALDTMRDTFANTSIFNAAGNHEADTYSMSKFFNYTQPSSVTYNGYGEALQDYYSFDYANAHFVVLDTNDASKDGLGEAQLAWLEADLEANEAKWTFVLMHKSLYSTGAHANDNEVVAMRAQLVPIFKAAGVNIVFGGHDHVYAEANVDGVLYVTLGTVGTKFYEYTNDNADVKNALDYSKTLHYTLDSQTFGYVKISGDTLTYNGYKFNAETGAIAAIDQTLVVEKLVESLRGNLGKDIKISFFSSNIGDGNAYDLGVIPEGFTLKFVANGKSYDHMGDITYNATSTDVEVYLVAPNGQEIYATTWTVERENYALGVALFTVGAVAAAAGIAVAVLLSLKKKKSAAVAAEAPAEDNSDADEADKN